MMKVSRLSNRLAKALKRPSSEDKKKQMPAILVLDGLRGVRVRLVSKSNAVTRAKDIPEKAPHHSAVDKISRPFNSVTKLLGRPSSENEEQQVSVKPKPHGRGSVGSGTASASHAVASSKEALETRQGPSTMGRTSRQLGRSSAENGGKQPLVKRDKHGLGGKEVDTASASKGTITVKSKPETSRGPLALRRISLLADRVAKSLRRSFSKESKSPSPNNLAQHTLSGKSKPRKVTFAETPHPARNGPPRRRKRRVVRPPLLLTVPDNVLYLIRDQLSLHGANFLSLVCKRFYAVINPDLRGIDLGRYGASFLRHLEEDAPERVVYCAFCNMLHNLPLSPELGCALGKVRGADAGARSWCYHIDWPLVRSVTNRHFLAHPKRKWPFEKGPFRLPPERHWTKAWPAWKTFRHARVINGELYVRNVHCLRSRPNQGAGPPGIGSTPADEHDVCEHLVSGSVEYYKPQYRSRVRRTRQYRSKSGKVRRGKSWITDVKSPCPVQKRRGSCEICYTDYSRTIFEDKEQGYWAVWVWTFQRLGSGRLPNELPWACGSNLECGSRMPTRREAGDRYNSIRYMWVRDENKDYLRDEGKI